MEYSHCKERKVSVLEGEELFFNKLLSRNSSVGCCSPRILYYRPTAKGVPFEWEMHPGIPKASPTADILTPLSPPPALLRLGLPKPCISTEEPKASVISKLVFWKHSRKLHGEINKKFRNGSVKFEFYSSDGGEYFTGSPASPSNSISSSSSSFSFSSIHSSHSSRLQSPQRNSVDDGDFHGCGTWNFTSVLVRLWRKV